MSRPKQPIIPYRQLKSQLEQWRPLLAPELQPDWQLPADSRHGLLTTNLSFQVGASLKQSPLDLVTVLESDLAAFIKTAELPLESEIVGPYLNLRLSQDFYAALLEADLTSNLIDQDQSRVMLEYIGANVAKRLHAGHMRNLNIGESLRRLFKLKYPRLITDNHWGDWGVQFGIILWAYKQAVDTQAYQQNPIEELQRLYVWGNQQKAKVSNLDKLVRQEFIKLEQGDAQNRRLWEEFVKLSKAELKPDLELMNVPPTDLEQGESFYGADMRWLADFMDEHDVWHKDGKARYFDFEPLAGSWKGLDPARLRQVSGLGRCYLVSSDGYTTYAFRDVAARWQWARDHKISLAITVTDKTQQHSFEQAFAIICYLASLPSFRSTQDPATIKRLNLDALIHIGYGFLELTSGKMSSRKGNVLRLPDLVSEVGVAAGKELLKRDPSLAEASLAERSRVIAVASLKWADLNRDPATDVVLDPKSIVEFEGNTGAYQLYTYARIRSVLRKATDNPANQKPSTWMLGPTEAKMAQQVYAFPDILQRAVSEYRPNLLTNHLLDLTNLINSWYSQVPIIREADAARRQQLIKLCLLLADHMEFALGLLGIVVLEEM